MALLRLEFQVRILIFKCVPVSLYSWFPVLLFWIHQHCYIQHSLFSVSIHTFKMQIFLFGRIQIKLETRQTLDIPPNLLTYSDWCSLCEPLNYETDVLMCSII